MLALLKIRLIKIRRQPLKNLFLYFFPVLALLSMALFLIINEKWEDYLSLNPSEGNDFVLFNSTSNKIHTIEYALVICEDDIIRTSFVHFFQSTCSLKKECKIYNYTSYDSFYQSKLSDNYNYYYRTIVFYITGTRDNITFTLISNSFQTDSIEYSSNLLNYNYYYYHPPKLLNETHRIIAEFIKSINELPIEKNLIKVDYASYPLIMRSNTLYKYSLTIWLPLINSLAHVSIIFNFFFWMLSEKQDKLVDFLNRQGVTQLQYIFSWLLTFIVIELIPVISMTFILSFFYFFQHYFILLLFVMLFNLSLFAVAFFYHSFIDKIQTGSTILKLMYVGVSLLSYVIVQPQVPLSIKLCFSLFP